MAKPNMIIPGGGSSTAMLLSQIAPSMSHASGITLPPAKAPAQVFLVFRLTKNATVRLSIRRPTSGAAILINVAIIHCYTTSSNVRDGWFADLPAQAVRAAPRC